MSSEIEGMGNIRYPSPLHGFRFSWFLGNCFGVFCGQDFLDESAPPPPDFHKRCYMHVPKIAFNF